jgi:uncharacterized membrane protein (UPF0127 family)
MLLKTFSLSLFHSRKFKYVLGIIIFIGILGTVYLLSLSHNKNDPEGNQHLPIDHVLTLSSGKEIPVRVADTPQRQQWGLSFFHKLEQGTGMIFIFPRAESQGFWMKDMQFPLDIIWMRKVSGEASSYEVVTVKSFVAPDTYPTVFYPTDLSDTVLEIEAGAAAQWGIIPGTRGTLTNN